MIVIYAIVSSELLLKHLSCRSLLDLGWSQNIRGLLTFRIRYKFLKRGKEIYPCSPSHRGISRVNFIRHLSWNITGMRSDNALPMTVSTKLILTSKIFPWLVFSGFPHSSKTSTPYSSCHLLKPFLFHILHVTQSRVPMRLTGSRISVKKLAVRRKYWKIWTLSWRKKIDLKNISLLQCVILC